jgi:hypothetical protein
MNFVDYEGAPGFLGQVPFVSSELVADPFGDAGWSVNRYGPRRNMHVPQKMVEAHQVVHMSVADEHGINRTQDSFRQVVKLSAVEQKGTTGRPDIDEHDRIIEQTGEHARLQIAELTKILHGVTVVSVAKYTGRHAMFPIHASLKTPWVLLPPCQKSETETFQREADMIDSNSMTQH